MSRRWLVENHQLKTFEPSASLGSDYARVLRLVSKRLGSLLRRYFDEKGNLFDVDGFVAACKKYSVELEPWAVETATKFVKRVERQNGSIWRQAAKASLGAAGATGTLGVLYSVHQGSLVHHAVMDLVQEQAALIKSLTETAAQRVQEIAVEAAISGDRSPVVYKKIMDTEQVTTSRAALIARTELAKANAVITRARADAAGVTHYIWRTAGDERVRDTHLSMEGVVCEFARPPAVEGEGNHHAGEYPNCRCYAEPIFTEIVGT